MMAKQLIEGGISDCVLAVGFEKMQRGSLTTQVNNFSLCAERQSASCEHCIV